MTRTPDLSHHRPARLLTVATTRSVSAAATNAAEAEYARLLLTEGRWARSWASYFLTSVMSTLDSEDPWRNLAGSDGHAVRLVPGISVPDGEVGAWTRSGDRFGLSDCLDLMLSVPDDLDLYCDSTMAAVADGITPQAACLLSAAGHSSSMVFDALGRIIERCAADPGLPPEQIFTRAMEHFAMALRWAVWRRANYAGFDDAVPRELSLHAAARADCTVFELPDVSAPTASLIIECAVAPGTYRAIRETVACHLDEGDRLARIA